MIDEGRSLGDLLSCPITKYSFLLRLLKFFGFLFTHLNSLGAKEHTSMACRCFS